MKKMLSAVILAAVLMSGCSGLAYDKDTGEVGAVSVESSSIQLDAFGSIEAEVSHTDIAVVSGDGYSIAYEHSEPDTLSFEVTGSVLAINEAASGKVYNFYSGGNNKLVITVPQETAFESMRFNSSGDISISDFSIGSASFNCSYTNINLKNLAVGNLIFELNNVDITSDDVVVDSCILNNSYGSLQGSGFSSTSLKCQIDNCDIDLTGNIAGTTELKGSYSNVSITTSRAKSGYAYELACRHGEINVDGANAGESASYESDSAANNIYMDIDSGTIKLKFL